MITIYSTQKCHYCNLAKEYFEKNNIPYKSLDVQIDLKARSAMIEVSEQIKVPVITFGDYVQVGWDENNFIKEYGEYKHNKKQNKRKRVQVRRKKTPSHTGW